MFCGDKFKSMVVWSRRRLNEDGAARELLRSGTGGSRKRLSGRIVERNVCASTVDTLDGRTLCRSKRRV